MEYCDSVDLGNPIDDFLKGDTSDDVQPNGVKSQSNGRRCILRSKDRVPKDNTLVEQEAAEREAAEVETQARTDKLQFRKMLMLDEAHRQKDEAQEKKEKKEKERKAEEKKQ